MRTRQTAFKLALYVPLLALVAFLCVFFLCDMTYVGTQRFWQHVQESEIWFAVYLSLVTAGVTALLTLLIGTPVAYSLSRFKFFGSPVIDVLVDLPIVLPPLIIGVFLLGLFRTSVGQWIEKDLGIEFIYTRKGILIAQFATASSFGIRVLKGAFDGINPRFEQVARTLGCSHRQAFFKVTLPMAKTGLMAGLIITWAKSMAEFGPILFFCGATRWKTEIMPVSMFLDWRVGDIERALAICLLAVIVSGIILVVFKRLGGKGYLW